MMAFEFEAELAAFTQVMRDKLTEKQYKKTWKDETAMWLYQRLLEEAGELAGAMQLVREHKKPVSEVAREAADVACFAMMIADVFGALVREGGCKYPQMYGRAMRPTYEPAKNDDNERDFHEIQNMLHGTPIPDHIKPHPPLILTENTPTHPDKGTVTGRWSSEKAQDSA